MIPFVTTFTEAAEARIALMVHATGLTRDQVIVGCIDLGLQMMERRRRGERFTTTLPENGRTVELEVTLSANRKGE
jgi:hypothetical protein